MRSPDRDIEILAFAEAAEERDAAAEILSNYIGQAESLEIKIAPTALFGCKWEIISGGMAAPRYKREFARIRFEGRPWHGVVEGAEIGIYRDGLTV